MTVPTSSPGFSDSVSTCESTTSRTVTEAPSAWVTRKVPSFCVIDSGRAGAGFGVSTKESDSGRTGQPITARSENHGELVNRVRDGGHGFLVDLCNALRYFRAGEDV